ncbi:Gfo/Idh/MocA family protein [Jannaschia aquimarina]|uniref:IolG protein n=1 Tax=Jannaschia aquimarina TaxID=935700 RepID=A0A0D1EI91_9RHOB|nr:Gfo/Idh/MocA family oxidoreductase [Jannaschia aquimarina]KIT16631.1 Inositol 2-dehydrogenase [Jannaschia aquimarina]SNS93830.1 Predicted dehydrogenase [Jannaschia aquimarina]
MIRYGLIGGGMMGQEHIRNINLLEGARVTAVADPDEGMRRLSLATAQSNRGYLTAEDLIAREEVDAYLVAAPNDLHAGLVQRLLATDKPILVEKPLATTTADCRDLLNMAKGRRAPVWVAMEYRYMPPVQHMLAALDQGATGTPRMVSIREHRFPFLPKVDAWNRFNARTGGTLVEKCCHFWDLMRLILRADPVRVYASAGIDVNHRDERYYGARPDIVDNAFVVVDFSNGARGMLDLCMFAEGSHWQEQIAVTGENARIEAFIPGPARFAPDGKPREAEVVTSIRALKEEVREVVHTPPELLIAGDHHGSTFYQHERFLKLVREGGGVPEVTLDDGYWSVLVGEAAEESARSGQAIDLRGRGA